MLVNKLSKGIGLSLLAALAFVFVACTSPSSSSSSSGTTDTTGGGGTPDGGGGGTTNNYPTMTFDETASPKYGLGGFEGANTSVTTIADAGITADTGDNAASGNIIKIVNTANGQTYAGALFSKDGQTTGLSSFFKFIASTSAKKTVTARVYAPAADIPVTLKLQSVTGRADTTGDSGIESTVLTTSAGWQTLTWDFNTPNIGNPPQPADYPTHGWDFKAWWGTFTPARTTSMSLPAPAAPADKVAIFFDYQQPKTAEKTFYLDNIRFTGDTVEPVTPATPASAAQTISFDETASPQYSLNSAGADATQVTSGAPTDSGTNAAAGNYFKVVNAANAADAAGVNILKDSAATGLGTLFAFGATGNKTVSARVYSPAVDVPVTFHIANADAPPKVVEATVLTTAIGWQTLTWDFAATATGNPSAEHILSPKTYQNGSPAGGPAYKEWSAVHDTTTHSQVLNVALSATTAPTVAFFIDFNQPKTAEKTYYVDNIRLGDETSTSVITFDETTGDLYGLGGFGNATTTVVIAGANGVPADTGTNAATANVYKVVNPANSELYAGFNTLKDKTKPDVTIGMDTFFALNSTTTNKKISMRIWAPAADIPVTAKLDGVSPAVTATVLTTKQGWQTLTWDFGGIVTGDPSAEHIVLDSVKTFQNGSTAGGWDFKRWLAYKGASINIAGDAPVAPADQAQIFFDYQQKKSAEKIFYIDNIRFGAAPQ